MGCKGSDGENHKFVEDYEVFSQFFVLSILFIWASVTVATTFFIYLTRSCKEIPYFVTAQMILLNLVWISYTAYYSIVFMKMERGDDLYQDQEELFYENIMATIGNVSIIMHDWIFTE